jgi:hypothetical protein
MEEAFKIAGQEIEKALGDATSGLSNPGGPSCPQCGKKNPLGASFCFSCGGRIPSAA